jgi:hypothetical protein
MFDFLRRRRAAAAVAACRAELARTAAADASMVSSPRDMQARAGLLDAARQAGASDAGEVRQLDSLQRLLAVLRTKGADAAAMELALADARSLNLGETTAVRTFEAACALAVVRERGPQAIRRAAAGRRVYFSGPAEHKNRQGTLEVREDGLTFTGEVLIEIPWANVAHVAEVVHETRDALGAAIAIQEGKRRTATKFVLWDAPDQSLGCEVAVKAWEQFRAASTAAPATARPVATGTHATEGRPAGAVLTADLTIDTPAGPVPAVRVPGTGRGYFFEVVGESFYQDALRALPEEPTVRLTAEPDNPHDANAVAIQSLDCATLGYMPREEAARYQQLILQLAEGGLAAVCQATVIGGTAEKPSRGIILDLDGPTIVASKLGLQYERRGRSDPHNGE